MLDVIQSMIDISADRLERLRTQCATSAELTQQEIRTLEAKLVKMFSELLVARSKLPDLLCKGLSSTGSELKQWLRVVGKWSLSLSFPRRLRCAERGVRGGACSVHVSSLTTCYRFGAMTSKVHANTRRPHQALSAMPERLGATKTTAARTKSIQSFHFHL